ncbi:MAG: thymidine kinase [Acidobacteriota bacterium]|jgi:thymidine kinase|nr:thymidine kinase [Acidobacteriota bacterium]
MERLTAEGNDEHLVRVGHTGAGWIEVIAGSMFSGKSEELIRRLRRAKIARLRVQVFKPEIDVRFSRDHIVSHSEMRHESDAVRSAAEILSLVEPATEVVGIDEGQFFDNDLISVANALAARGVRVIIAGLDQDYTGRPFGPMPQLLAVAEYITKTHAICVRCGQPANYSQRIVEVEGQVVVGASDTYEARCRRCFVPHADAPTRYVEDV